MDINLANIADTIDDALYDRAVYVHTGNPLTVELPDTQTALQFMAHLGATLEAQSMQEELHVLTDVVQISTQPAGGTQLRFPGCEGY